MSASIPRSGPAIVVHGVAHLQAALHAAREANLPALRVLSAPAAACFMGPAWWRALIATAGTNAVAMRDMLDCGDAAGRAMEALRLGQRALILARSPQWQAVAERAEALGAVLLDERPAALDLGARGAERRLAGWLRARPDVPDDSVRPPG